MRYHFHFPDAYIDAPPSPPVPQLVCPNNFKPNFYPCIFMVNSMLMHLFISVFPELKHEMIDFLVMYHAWTTSRFQYEKDIAAKTLEEKLNDVTETEREQGRSQSRSSSPETPSFSCFGMLGITTSLFLPNVALFFLVVNPPLQHARLMRVLHHFGPLCFGSDILTRSSATELQRPCANNFPTSQRRSRTHFSL